MPYTHRDLVDGHMALYKKWQNCSFQALGVSLGEKFAMVSYHTTRNTSTQSICQTTHAHKDLSRDITSWNPQPRLDFQPFCEPIVGRRINNRTPKTAGNRAYPQPDYLGLCNILLSFIRNNTQTAVTNMTLNKTHRGKQNAFNLTFGMFLACVAGGIGERASGGGAAIRRDR